MKKAFFVISAFAFILALSGCNEKKQSLNPDQSYNRVKAAGVLVMGHMGDFPPMVFTDKDNRGKSPDIERGRAVVRRCPAGRDPAVPFSPHPHRRDNWRDTVLPL